ncbi:hypothetical protein ACQ4PT_013493 [Festuca glaucescens]
MGMQYGKESQDALVKHIAGNSVTVYVYGQDQYNRYVGDIYCGGVFIQEHMLKEGHAWRYKIYDKRPEFVELPNSSNMSLFVIWILPFYALIVKWDMEAWHARQGLWASDVRYEKTSDSPDKTRAPYFSYPYEPESQVASS